MFLRRRRKNMLLVFVSTLFRALLHRTGWEVCVCSRFHHIVMSRILCHPAGHISFRRTALFMRKRTRIMVVTAFYPGSCLWLLPQSSNLSWPRSEAVDSVIIGTSLALARTLGPKQSLCCVEGYFCQGYFCQGYFQIYGNFHDMTKLHCSNPQGQSAAAGVVGYAALVCITVYFQVWKTVAHATLSTSVGWTS